MAGVHSAWGLRVLGVPGVRQGDDAFRPLERKAAALLAYLAIEGPTPRATLAGLLWPSVVDSRARNNLRQLLHRLREHAGLLESGPELRLGDVRVDVAELHRLQELGDSQAIAEAWGAEAPVLLRAQELDDCPDLAEWLEAERARVLDAVTRAVEAEAERHEAGGDLRRALVQAQRLLELDPLSEAAYRRAMRLHYLAGDRPQALATYHRCQEVLQATFGVDPLPDTLELARAIDAGTVARSAPAQAQALPVRLRRPPRLVGREDVWARLEDAWQRVRTIVVVGEAGIGKTRLLHDFVRSKGPFLMSKGVPGERNVPYAAIAQRIADLLREQPGLAAEGWIRAELSRILPHVFEPPTDQAPIAGELQRLRLFEATATVLRRALEGKVALFNDDLHLWDDASFELGTYCIARFADSHARSLSTARTDDFAPGHLREVERAAEAGLAEIIELGPLDLGQIGTLVREVGAEASADPGEVLELSGGNPFYALEFLRSRWSPAGGDDAPPAPGSRAVGTAGVLDSRLRRLSGQAQDLLRVRAFAGTAFSPELAAAVLEIPLRDVQASLAELHRLRLLGNDNEAHELVYDAVTRRTPGEARRLWHQRVAVQLAAFGAGPAAIADQYLAAWQPATAFPYLLRAADDARAVYVLDDARRWFLRALWAAADDRQRAEALLGLDDVGGQRAPIDETGAWLDELETLAGRLQEPSLLIETALRRARWLTRRGDHDAAARLAKEAYDDARRLDDRERAERARLTLADLAYFAGRYDEAQRHFLEAAEDSADAGRLRAFQRLGALEAMQGDVAAAVEHHRQALALARRMNDLPLVATLLNSVGADSERLNDYAEAARHFRSAAEVAGRIGDRRTAAIALANAALTHAGLGELAASLGTAERALDAARPLGFDRSVAMAHFVHGYALRRLGRPDPARVALAEAERVREAASDVRGALVARFNLAAMALEAKLGANGVPGANGGAGPADAGDAGDAAGAHDAPPPADAEAVITELEALDIPQFLAWCLLELAFLDPDPTPARARVDRALALEDGEHLRFAAAAAALRIALLSGEAAEVRRARTELESHMAHHAFLETSLAHLLLARSASRHGEREEQRALAHAQIGREVGDLGGAALAARLAYLERRVPQEG